MCVTEVLVRCDARTRVVVLVYWGCSSKVCGIVVGHGLWRWEGHGLLRGYGFFWVVGHGVVILLLHGVCIVVSDWCICCLSRCIS